MENKRIFCTLVVLSCLGISVNGALRRCVDCRSRGEGGSCKDPFTMNATMIESEPGVDVVPCASGWCGKVIESPNLNNEYGTATQRMCLQRGPDDGEERCAYTIKNYKKVWMCFCNGDMCNNANSIKISGLFVFIASLIVMR
ncbi:uncharacterized protein Rtv [Diachasmimorpha longicaudata]|uniref:uncharacterized protein Rtv n=1 Tax=Diachasmimorpha longicaudata TaxID=58733 RepID=UPI0030B90695